MRRFVSATIVAAILIPAGCGKFQKNADERNREEILAALEAHLYSHGNLNMSAMAMELEKVEVKGDDASALVQFRSKQNGAAMQLTYALKRQQGRWVVIGVKPGPGQREAVGSELPPGHPAFSQPSPPTQTPAANPPAKR